MIRKPWRESCEQASRCLNRHKVTGYEDYEKVDLLNVSLLNAPPRLLHAPLQDIYLFGGQSADKDGAPASSSKLHKLSIGE